MNVYIIREYVSCMGVHGHTMTKDIILATTSYEETKRKLTKLSGIEDVGTPFFGYFWSVDFMHKYAVDSYHLDDIYSIMQLYRIFKGRR